MNLEKLCLQLVMSNSEESVVGVLKSVNLWDEALSWKFYGANENNFATIGNQQSQPEAALVEKLINSVDAVLLAECLKLGVDPTSNKAPSSITEALEKYFSLYAGKLTNISPRERTALAKKICLVATGTKLNPCYSIIDEGEGQSPSTIEDTILSIGKSNKLRIPFVQGKFNMGGTGVLQFCGSRNLQLIVTRRNREIPKSERDSKYSDYWSFTIVRRENPKLGMRSSSYTYLAPNGEVPKFKADSLFLLPGAYPDSYSSPMNHGTFIKLYEYQMTGLRTNIVFDLYNRLSLLMPSIALPIRLYERRKGYSGHSLETTLAGLSVRLEDDKLSNLEEAFVPAPSSEMVIANEKMKISIYVFKRGMNKKYTKREGIIFTVNGQTHGAISRDFFARTKVGMAYLKDSLLFVCDCSGFSARVREDLFMNSRDRLRSGTLKVQIESQLTELVRNHSGLRDLKANRRRQDIENKLEDSKPLVDVVTSLMKNSPTLANLFIKGIRIPNPFKVETGEKDSEFKGKMFPTFFKLIGEYPSGSPKKCHKESKFRVQFKTDVSNDYFDRECDSGSFILKLNGSEIADYSITLWNGFANLSVSLPIDIPIESTLEYESLVNDISRINPIANNFTVHVMEQLKRKGAKGGIRKPPSSAKPGDDVEKEGYLDLPNIVEVRREAWGKHEFTRDSAVKAVDSGENGYDFFINMDNIHLLTEKKFCKNMDFQLVDARYKYGMVLVGLSLLRYSKQLEKHNDTETQETLELGSNAGKFIGVFCEAISPILLPMISGLSEMSDIDVN